MIVNRKRLLKLSSKIDFYGKTDKFQNLTASLSPLINGIPVLRRSPNARATASIPSQSIVASRMFFVALLPL